MATVTIRSLPPEERPRERLWELGPDALSDGELLAVLIGNGFSGESALGLAHRMLAECGGLRGIVRVPATRLLHLPGMGPAKAARVLAALELGHRLTRLPARGRRIANPADVVAALGSQWQHSKERFLVMLLDVRQRLLATEEVSVGSLLSTIAEPREVFRSAIAAGAAQVILVHNHPSGDPTPSRQDRLLTRRLREAGRLLGVSVVDHIILGENGFVSLRTEEGDWQD